MSTSNTFWVSPEQKIDRLIKKLANAQAEIAVMTIAADKSKARIAHLESLINDAPHSETCACLAFGDCDCFKARV